MEEGVLYAWDVPEYSHHERQPDWFWAVGIIGLCFAVVAIIFHDVLFGIFLAIGTFTLITLNIKPPENVHCEIKEKGIQIKSVFYLYKKIKFYAIVGEDGQKKLVIETERIFMPHIFIPVDDGAVERIDELLSPKLTKNTEYEEPGMHKILDSIGI